MSSNNISKTVFFIQNILLISSDSPRKAILIPFTLGSEPLKNLLIRGNIIYTHSEKGEKMERREFLEWLGVVGLVAIGTVTTGCGGGVTSTSTKSFQTKISLNGKARKTVSVNSGETVLGAIKKAFPYQRLENATVIDDISGNWRYSVNGIEPKVYAGNYHLRSDSIIDLRLI